HMCLLYQGCSVSQITQPGFVQDYTLVRSWLVSIGGRGRHAKFLSEESARIRWMAQGKCHPRLALGDWNASDGRGGCLRCGAVRRRDKTLKDYFGAMEAPAHTPAKKA